MKPVKTIVTFSTWLILVICQDWTAVTKEVKIIVDLEETPLMIKTSSTIGSEEEVFVMFYNEQEEEAGGIALIFTNPPMYGLLACSKYIVFTSTLPTDVNKVWTIFRTTGGLKVDCNGVEVANSEPSDVVCNSSTDSSSDWSSYWSRDVAKIKFDSDYDTASQYYRVQLPQCSGLDPQWNNLKTDTKFPVVPGTVVTATCSNTGHLNKGSTEITCQTDVTFTFSTQPSCVAIDLNGFENLSTNSGTAVEDKDAGDAGVLKDINLDNGLAASKAPFTTDLSTRHGIYKVILYAKTSTDSIEGWKVSVKDTTAQKSDTQSNELNAVTPCKSGDAASTGTDAFPFLCDANLAATQVIVQSVSASAELAEIVVVGFKWDAYPCGKGYSSTDGTHSNTGGQGCRECDNGTYQGKFSATNWPAKCTACVNRDTNIHYTNTLEHKQATSCEVCAAPDVAKGDASGCEKCPAGEEYKAVGESSAGCTYPTDLASKRANPGFNVENTTPSGCTSVTCEACPPGTHNPAGSVKYCYQCPDGQIPNSAKDGCDTCVAGTFEQNNECKPCSEAGKYEDTPGQKKCEDCTAGRVPNAGKTACDQCPKGTKEETDVCVDCLKGEHQNLVGQTMCKACPSGHVSTAVKQENCDPCKQGQEPNGDKTACVDCAAGKFQEAVGGAACKDCAVGHYSANPKTCTPCNIGMYQDVVGQTNCLSCEKGNYQDQIGQGVCAPCPYNTYSKSAGTAECTTCAADHYAMPSSETCTKCPDGSPDEIRRAMAGKDEELKDKCLSDLGKGCLRREIKNKYGTFRLPWLNVKESESFNCGHDDDAPAFKAKFTCIKTKCGLRISEAYTCKNTKNSKKIKELTKDDVPVEDKTSKMEVLTENVNSNGIGDVEAVSDVLESITEDKANPGNEVVIEPAVTASILNTVSNLVASDLKVSSSEEQAKSASSISNNMLKQIVKVAQTTSVKNKPVTSKNVAVIDVRQEDDGGYAPNKKSGIMSFTLPKGDKSNKDLNRMEVGSGSDDEKDTILLIETKAGDKSSAVDMAIVLITDSTLMPDTTISVIPASDDGSDSGTVQNILEDLQLDMEKEVDGQEAIRTYINSFITEIKIENPPDDFKLNLFMKPNIDIGGNNDSLKTEGDGQRFKISYKCSEYNPQNAKWTQSCNTIYDSANPSLGVLCLCTHNTSFAVLMSAYEVDRGYAEVQSYLTYVLLGLSTVGLILTLIFLIPAKALRSTRSTKINICFSMALLLASLVFLVQDAFVNAEDTGLIKLKSTGCAVYAMIQHYLWLVVFVWMVVEGFVMYLSLFQVFGSHISKYMLKFNIAAWGIPLPFPFIGYFVFTKKHTVGSITITKHDYLSDTMCFIKPESIAFYTLFLTPIVLVILVNLVFFALVAKVIKDSKSSGNISDQEQVLRQLKAAVGVMALLGTGWFVGIFMSLPEPQFQVGLQYLFILLNSSQGFFVFLVHIVLNNQVRNHWLVKFGLRAEKRPTTSSSGAGKSSATVTKATTASTSANHDNTRFENVHATNNEEHIYASAGNPTSGDNAGTTTTTKA